MSRQTLDEIEASGTTELPNGTRLPMHSHVGQESGRIIRASVQATRPRLAVEVGLAFGVSTLYILETMREHGDGILIGMDPAQHDATWRGGGLHNVRRAGLADRYRFHEEASQVVLPRLAASGTRIQLGFIDGWHTFDHTLVDFFFIDAMLDLGGMVILDDVGYPSVRRLCHFIITNRDYVVFDAERLPQPNFRRAMKTTVKTLLDPLVRDDFSPNALARQRQKRIDSAQLIALQKQGHDHRRFDHFVAF